MKLWPGRRVAREIFDLHNEQEIRLKIHALRLLAEAGKIPGKRIGKYWHYDPEFFQAERPKEKAEQPAAWLKAVG